MGDLGDVNAELRDEIEHFFTRYKELEHKPTETGGFGNRSQAEAIVEQARERAQENGR